MEPSKYVYKLYMLLDLKVKLDNVQISAGI